MTDARGTEPVSDHCTVEKGNDSCKTHLQYVLLALTCQRWLISMLPTDHYANIDTAGRINDAITAKYLEFLSSKFA